LFRSGRAKNPPSGPRAALVFTPPPRQGSFFTRESNGLFEYFELAGQMLTISGWIYIKFYPYLIDNLD
jgi:hypothetical protein